jgi:hypothetical protein
MEQNSQEVELPPKQIFELMKNNIFDNFFNHSYISINKDYISSRKALFNILHKITIKMGFKSQTFFLCAHYLDILFSKKRRINCSLNTLGLASLCLSAKFCENDPIVPHLQYFIRIFNHIMGYKNIISMSDLKRTEVLVLKLLNYKLNYYTIYDFNSFLFGHGILKIEQLKDIERKNRTHYQSRRMEFVINQSNSIMIKNVLEKIYKKSRFYLDTVIENTKLCFKYNPLYLSIYIMKKSVEEILYNEQKISNCSKNEQNEFYMKNSNCFKQIMSDFYKVDYEANEQYKKILVDDEILEIFGEKEKNEQCPAPPADKKIGKEDEKKLKNNNVDLNSNININEEIENKSRNTNTFSNGFYNRLKVKTNNESLKRRHTERIIVTSRKENTNINKLSNNNSNCNKKEGEGDDEDDLESNLNINEIQNVKWNNKKKTESKKEENQIPPNNKLVQNKYIISSNNRYMKKTDTFNSIKSSNTIKKKYLNSNYDLTYSVNSYRGPKIGLNKPNMEAKTEKISPKKFDSISNYTRYNQYMKGKALYSGNERSDLSYNANDSSNINNNSNSNNTFNFNSIKKYEKKPYFRKLIHQNTSDNLGTYNSINRNGISSYYYSSNSQINRIKVNENKTESNTLNRNNVESGVNNGVSSKINTFYSRIRIRDRRNDNFMSNKSTNNMEYLNRNNTEDSNEKKTIITTSSRYRRRCYNNNNPNYNTNTTNSNDISNEIQNPNNFIIKDNNSSKKEIESYSQLSSDTTNSSIFSKIATNNIFRRKNKILSLHSNSDTISNTSVNQNEINTNNKGVRIRSFYRNNTNTNTNKISVNMAIKPDNKNNSEMNNKPNESQDRRISYLITNKNSDLNDILKEINKANTKNNEKELKSNIFNNGENKKVYQSIRQKYLNINQNRNSNLNINLNNTASEANISKSKTIECSKKEYNNNSALNISNAVNKDNNISKARYIYRNRNINNDKQDNSSMNININNNSSIMSSRKAEAENKNKDKNITESSIYRILNKTKTLFSRSHKEEESNTNNKKIINLRDSNNNSFNNAFYKSSQNFYKPSNKSDNESNIKKEEKDLSQNSRLNNTTYLRSFINKNKINKENKDKPNSQSQKNSSTIVINNNININIGNKTNNINNEYVKYKSIYKKNNVPELNLNKALLTTKNSNNNANTNTNTNRNPKNSFSGIANNSNTGNTFSNLFQKLHFYRKNTDKNDSNNHNNNNIDNLNTKFQFFRRK